MYRDLERFDEAVADLNRVIELAPDDTAAKAQLSEVQTAMAVPSVARQAFKDARKLYNEDKWDEASEGFSSATENGLSVPISHTSFGVC